jgi:2-polyprenyl-3-methyl-5-hydroxy-6-metoxy-1,4-benzoquinol methylase
VSRDLTSAETHFAFGANWSDYARRIGRREIEESIAGLRRLFGDVSFAGKRFLDIGCGSGLHSLAALRLGASEVVAVDIDAVSVSTTDKVLSEFAPGSAFRVEQKSVFDLSGEYGAFDIVYSWGVLHHTGNMRQALRKAAALVAPGGLFAFALYRRTWLCRLWTIEKRWYSRASPRGQQIAQRLFHRWSRFLSFAKHPRAAERMVGKADVRANVRGMELHHDIHDWLGGYPYESILPDGVDAFMTELGFRRKRSLLMVPHQRRHHGLNGSGNDEYLYARL